MVTRIWCALLVTGLSLPFSHFARSEPVKDNRPNFLVIVADDLGFSDLGVMGSEIQTPHLDALAGDGLLMTNFHVAPTCSPTRAMLLTGVDTHRAGLGTMNSQASPEQENQPGYEGVMGDRVVTVARLLKDAGYHTYLTGKWHLGTKPDQRPAARGFERSFGPISGGASHFSDQLAMFFPGKETAKALYYEDDEEAAALPADFYSTDFYTDKLIQQIEGGRETGAPFLALATYTAPHWPLQVPDGNLADYRGVYDEGFDVLRTKRVEALKVAGIISSDSNTPARVGWEMAWSDKAVNDQARSARQMELYAAMVTRLDHNIGRLIRYLRETGQYDNTLVLFFSDNGAEGNRVNRIVDDHGWVERRFDNRLGNMGRPGSYVFLDAGWAQAVTAPLRFYKAFPSEGGIRVPAIAAGGIAQARGVTSSYASVRDVTPTLLSLAGVASPAGHYQGREVATIEGVSMAAFLAGQSPEVHLGGADEGWELFGRRAYRLGDWKILWLYEPYGNECWALFNLKEDPAERRDLSHRHPEKLAELETAWRAYLDRNNVILPANDAAYALDDPWRSGGTETPCIAENLR